MPCTKGKGGLIHLVAAEHGRMSLPKAEEGATYYGLHVVLIVVTPQACPYK